MTDIEAKRAARRAAMPITTAFVEQYAEFGAKLIYAQEGGITFGKPPQYTEVFTIPANYGMPSGTPTKKGAR
jgi:hypothetical protein